MLGCKRHGRPLKRAEVEIGLRNSIVLAGELLPAPARCPQPPHGYQLETPAYGAEYAVTKAAIGSTASRADTTRIAKRRSVLQLRWEGGCM